MEKNQRCVMCGTADWEWDPAHGGNRFAYEAVEQVCRGCYVKEAVARDLDHSEGSTVILVPTTGREAAKRHVRAKQAYLGGAR